MTSGFYKYYEDTETLIGAPNFVYGPTFSLLATEYETYDLPVDGWYWFDTKEAALAFFNLPEDVNFQE